MTSDYEGDVYGAAKPTAEALTAVFGEAAPGTVFSEPIQVGDDVVVTAVAWERAGGFGFGGGEGTNDDDSGHGGGGGGGGASQGRPVAVIRITPAGVEVKPVIDFTKIGLTLLLGVFGVWRVLRR
ncbi:MAG: hypothetical protein O6923_03150 [Actinobacteria bacterium]|nr:hypothetical protein [Actinomycetota bacterium]